MFGWVTQTIHRTGIFTYMTWLIFRVNVGKKIPDPCIYCNPKPSMYEGNQLGQPVPPAKRQRTGRSLMIPQTLLVEKSQGGMKDSKFVFRLAGGQFGCTCTSVSNGRWAGGHHCDAPSCEERCLQSDKKHGSMAQCIGTLWQS